MSSPTSNIIDLKIPSWHGIVEGIPQEETVIHNALRHAIKFQEGLEGLSPNQYNDPIIAGQIQQRLTELGGMLNLPVPDIRENVSTEGRAVISNEGIVVLFKSMIDKIIKWLLSAKDWFLDLFKSSKVKSKAQEATASTVKRQMDREVSSNKTVDRDAIASFAISSRALVIFHTPAHNPQIGYKYNSGNINSSFADVEKYSKTMKAALEDDLKALIDGVNLVADSVLNDRQIPGSDLFKINTHRQLIGLAHNKFELIGMGLLIKPITSDFSVRKEKIGMINVARENGWYNEGTFELSVSANEIKDFTSRAENQITTLNKLSDSVQDQLSKSNVVKRITDLKKYTDAVLKEGSDLEPAQQTMLMKRLLAVQELVMQLQINVQTFDLFVKNYNNLLISVGSSAIRGIKEISDVTV